MKMMDTAEIARIWTTSTGFDAVNGNAKETIGFFCCA
jgi:hypothetical protein